MKRTLMEEMIIAAARAIVAVADANVNTVDGAENNATTAKKAKAAKKAEPVEDDADDVEAADVDQEVGGLEEKTTKELYQMCVDAGIKVPKYGKNKQFYIAALNDAGVGDDAKEEAEDDGKEDEDKYAGKTAKELFELCKKRGIKAAPKKKAEFYVDLLKKADDAEGDEDDDDWGDEDAEDEPAPAPKKTIAAKKATTTKKQAKKAAPADDEDDDDDDDWDI